MEDGNKNMVGVKIRVRHGSYLAECITMRHDVPARLHMPIQNSQSLKLRTSNPKRPTHSIFKFSVTFHVESRFDKTLTATIRCSAPFFKPIQRPEAPTPVVTSFQSEFSNIQYPTSQARAELAKKKTSSTN